MIPEVCFPSHWCGGSRGGPHICGMDVELRRVTDADVEVFYEQQLDPEARRVAVFPLRDHDTFTTHWRKQILANDANYAWTIVAAGEVAGP